MASPTPLKGAELIDCARANGSFGIAVAAERCGYERTEVFEQELKQACEAIGVEFRGFDHLVKPADNAQDLGVIISPDTSNQL